MSATHSTPQRPKLALIAAMAKNRVIGRDNGLPWQLPEDLKRFRQITSGCPILMGRKTFESIGRVLPQRQNIVITRQQDLEIPGAQVVSSLEEAIQTADAAAREVFVIGGGEIYRQALGLADRLYVTWIDHKVDGDAYFPEWKDTEFVEVAREERSEPFRHYFLTLDRRA